MTKEDLDTTGLTCPNPVLKIALQVIQMRPGDVLEVRGDCPTFERDVREWCKRVGKTIISIASLGEYGRQIRIQL